MKIKPEQENLKKLKVRKDQEKANKKSEVRKVRGD
jgi:hypothetical protein